MNISLKKFWPLTIVIKAKSIKPLFTNYITALLKPQYNLNVPLTD